MNRREPIKDTSLNIAHSMPRLTHPVDRQAPTMHAASPAAGAEAAFLPGFLLNPDQLKDLFMGSGRW
ncbi:hypothetical protein AB0N62_37260 [Streptomyces sp. NPDC093982]|uniref:hypothetical protein n=1 Tax=Streptomyces sp. NPDC093982 TaxID=3155077 RepID=UPI0034374E47